MASTIEILLSSKFDDSGFGAAEAKIQEITSKLKGEFLQGETVEAFKGDLFPTGAVEKYSDELKEVAEGLRDSARAAEELGDHKLADDFMNQAAAAERAEGKFKKLATLTKSELIKGLKDTSKSLDEMQKELEQTEREMKQLEAAAMRQRKTGAAEVYRQTGNNARSAANDIRRLREETQALAGAEGGAQFRELFEGGSTSVDDFQHKMRNLRDTFEKTRDEAIMAGDHAGAIGASENIQALEQFDRQLFGIRGSYEHLGREAGLLGNILSHPFNQLGFALFVTQSSFRNLIMIAQAFFKIIDEGRQTTELFNAGAIAAMRQGEEIAALTVELQESSEYYIKQNDLIQNYIRLTNAQNTELANSAPLIGEVSASIAKLIGDTTKATEIQEEITEALISGNASAISASQGFLDLSEAEAMMALASERLGRELTDLEKSQIVYEQFVKESERLVEAASGLRGGADEIAEFKNRSSGAFTGLKEDIGLLADAFVGLLNDVDVTALDGILNALPGGANLRAGIEGVELLGDALKNTDGRAQDLIDTIDSIPPIVISTLNALPGGAALVNQLQLVRDKAEEAVEQTEALTDAVEELDDAAGRADLSNLVNIDISPFQEHLEYLLSEEYQFWLEKQKLREQGNEQIMDLWDKENEALDQLEEEHQKNLLDIQEDYQDQREEAFEDHLDKMEDLQEDHNDKLVKIDDDLAYKLEDISQDARDKREDAHEKANKKERDIEEDHQKKMEEIRRRFELQRLRALIDRDARALFEAEQAYEEAKRKEEERARDQREKNQEKLAQDLQDIDDTEEKKRQRAERDAERKRQEERKRYERARQDELDRYDEQLDDLEEAQADQTAKIEEAYLDRRQKIIKQYDKQEEDLRESLQDQFNDMAEAYNQQRILVETEAAHQTNIRLTEIMQQTTDLDVQLQAQKDLWKNYWQYVNNISNIPGGGTPPPPPTGDDNDVPAPPPQTGDPCASTATIPKPSHAGAQCFRPFNITYIAPDCSQWHCTFDQGWQPGPAPSGTGSNAPVEQPSGNNQISQNSPAGAPGSTGATVQLITNDPGLDEYLTSIAYDVIIDLHGT